MAYALVSFTAYIVILEEKNVALLLKVFAVDWISLGNSNVFINLMVK